MYKNSEQHLTDELCLLTWKLQKEFYLWQKNHEGESSNFFIDVNEISSIFQNLLDGDNLSNQETRVFDEKINELLVHINSQIAASDQEMLLLLKLQNIFDLSTVELRALISILAPEINKYFARIYGYLQDDMNQKWATPHLIFDLLRVEMGSPENGWSLFTPSAKLISKRLVYFEEPLTSGTTINIDERIKRFILKNNDLAFSLANIVEYFEEVPEYIKVVPNNRAKSITSFFPRQKTLWLYGTAREAKKQAIFEICKHFGFKLLNVDLNNIFTEKNASDVLGDLFREALIQDAVIVFFQGSVLQESNKLRNFVCLLRRWEKDLKAPVFICDDDVLSSQNEVECNWLYLEFENNEPSSSLNTWEQELQSTDISEIEIANFATKYPLNPSQIRHLTLCAQELHPEKKLTNENIRQILKSYSGIMSSPYTNKLSCHYCWEDLVMPESKILHLKEICRQITYHSKIYQEWGFSAKMPKNKGCNIMFIGSSGTGKTMTAEILAAEIQQDIYKVDIASLVSKYIGETEKNLKQIFKAAADANVVLFFDEADAIFGKRTTVKDAHDRYANISTDYLLQKLEEHNGVIILATNFSSNIDDAFLRRIAFIVEFPFPDAHQREILWKKMFPDRAPVGNIDYSFLAKKLPLCGGHIKNVVIGAAFLAAHSNSQIEMQHLCLAGKREFEKLGKVFNEEEFQQFF